MSLTARNHVKQNSKQKVKDKGVTRMSLTRTAARQSPYSSPRTTSITQLEMLFSIVVLIVLAICYHQYSNISLKNLPNNLYHHGVYNNHYNRTSRRDNTSTTLLGITSTLKSHRPSTSSMALGKNNDSRLDNNQIYQRYDDNQHALYYNFTEATMDWLTPHWHKLFPRRTNNNISINSFVKNIMSSKPSDTMLPNNCDDNDDDEACRLLLQSVAGVRYYMYPQDKLFSDRQYDMHALNNNSLDSNPLIVPNRYRGEIAYENDIYWALWNHSLRTDVYDEAHLIILPIPFGSVFFDKRRPHNNIAPFFVEIKYNYYRLLQQHNLTSGQKPHVTVSMTGPLFNIDHKHKAGRAFVQLTQAFHHVAVARGDDHLACHYAYLHNVTPPTTFTSVTTNQHQNNNNHDDDPFHGYDQQFATLRPMTNFQFSIGLGSQTKHLRWIRPTWQKFVNSSIFLFYHTTRGSSFCNSTVYRHAPVLNVSLTALPQPSSIGWDIPAQQWIQDFTNAKFCLVIRGDTPHSHALFNAIKVGCLPVVISDWYPMFAPPFAMTLDMRDFCIFLPELDFLQHPQRMLQGLQAIPEEVIRSKLRALEWAQRVVLLEHPQSLFVPAFVREAMASFSRPASELLEASSKKR